MAQTCRMLTVIAQYYRYTRDAELLLEYLPKIAGLGEFLQRRYAMAREGRDNEGSLLADSSGLPIGNDEADSESALLAVSQSVSQPASQPASQPVSQSVYSHVCPALFRRCTDPLQSLPQCFSARLWATGLSFHSTRSLLRCGAGFETAGTRWRMLGRREGAPTPLLQPRQC
jgi:hypothetical protein